MLGKPNRTVKRKPQYFGYFLHFLGHRRRPHPWKERTDCRHPADAASDYVASTVGVDASKGPDGTVPCGAHYIAQPIESQRRGLSRLRLGLEHTSRNQVIGSSRARSSGCGVDGAPNEKFFVRESSCLADRDAVFAQVHAVGVGAQRHIDPVVDDDARARLSACRHTSPDQAGEVAGRNFRFTNLHDVNAAGDRTLDLGEQDLGPSARG